jgi:NADH-quinone oxidoreductase subunit M
MYMLTMYRDVVFGEITNPKLETITDLNRMEWAIFIPLIIMTLWLGVSSTVVTDITAASVDNLITNYNAALPAPAQ